MHDYIETFLWCRPKKLMKAAIQQYKPKTILVENMVVNEKVDTEKM